MPGGNFCCSVKHLVNTLLAFKWAWVVCRPLSILNLPAW